MNIAEKVGNRIRILRKQKGLAQEKLANLAGIDRTYLPSIEKGTTNSTILILQKLADALEVPIQEFFKFDE